MATDKSARHVSEYWPQDTDTAFYMLAEHASVPLLELLERATAKWPGVTSAELTIDTEHVHLYCVTYDQYDPSDWALFLKISRGA